MTLVRDVPFRAPGTIGPATSGAVARWSTALLVLVLPLLEALAQPFCWTPLDSFPAPADLADENAQRLRNELARIAPEAKEVRKDLEDVFKERDKDWAEAIIEDRLMFGTEQERYVERVFKRIASTWSGMEHVHCFVSRDALPNAFTTGDGRICVNLGLMVRLRNEAQLAFVIGHELAHQQLDHVDRELINAMRKQHDPAFERELRKAVRGQYGRLARLDSLVLHNAFNQRRHSRSHEAQADSIGLVQMMKAGYDPGAALSVMDILDSCDDDPFRGPFDPWSLLKSCLDDDHGPHNVSASSLQGFDPVDQARKDSLKTHPDCQARKAALIQQLGATFPAVGPASEEPDTGYIALRETCWRDLVESELVQHDVSDAAYLALRLSMERPQDLYLRSALVRSFSLLHLYQKEHRISEVMGRRSKQRSGTENRFIAFCEELRLSDLACIGASFIDQDPERSEVCKETLYAAALHAWCTGAHDEFIACRDRYRARFPDDHHIRQLDSWHKGSIPEH